MENESSSGKKQPEKPPMKPPAKTSAKPPISLDQTMGQLKEALNQWKTLTPKGNSGKTETENCSKWLNETRGLLKELNRQLDELSS